MYVYKLVKKNSVSFWSYLMADMFSFRAHILLKYTNSQQVSSSICTSMFWSRLPLIDKRFFITIIRLPPTPFPFDVPKYLLICRRVQPGSEPLPHSRRSRSNNRPSGASTAAPALRAINPIGHVAFTCRWVTSCAVAVCST
jgi:hypothetical protein